MSACLKKDWNCHRCTFLNQHNNERCKLCDFANPQKKYSNFFQKRKYCFY